MSNDPMSNDAMTNDLTSSDPMTTCRTAYQHHAAQLGLAGATLGVAAGVLQMAVGTRIPEWTGAKDSPVALGALTIVLSAIAAFAAGWLRQPEILAAPRRAAVIVAFIVPALLCFTTVGRLWFLPGAMLLAASGLTLAAGGERWLASRTKPIIVVLMFMAALPFAVVTWWSLGSPLVAILALAIGLTTIRRNPSVLSVDFDQRQPR